MKDIGLKKVKLIDCYQIIAKQKKILNWEPNKKGIEGFRIGLKKTIDWFKKPDNLRRYKTKIYNL